MQLRRRFDHILTLKMTAEMRDDIDKTLLLVQDTLIRGRSEFIRAACQFMLDSLARGSGDVPVSVEERKERVLAGADEMEGCERTYEQEKTCVGTF
jgi:Arc/MetJ-type ribon-helix-helix transcriptional regulator